MFMEHLKPHTVYYMSLALLHLSLSEGNWLLAGCTPKSQTSISTKVMKPVAFTHNSVFRGKKKYLQRLTISYKINCERQIFSRCEDNAFLRQFYKVHREQFVRILLQYPLGHSKIVPYTTLQNSHLLNFK